MSLTFCMLFLISASGIMDSFLAGIAYQTAFNEARWQLFQALCCKVTGHDVRIGLSGLKKDFPLKS